MRKGGDGASEVPTLVIEDPQVADPLLLALRGAVWRHPMAAQALFAALVAEGRRFAATAEGRRWADRLAGAPLLDDVRVAWDLVTSRALEPDGDVVIPSVVVEALVKAATDRSLAELIALVAAAQPESARHTG